MRERKVGVGVLGVSNLKDGNPIDQNRKVKFHCRNQFYLYYLKSLRYFKKQFVESN